MLDMFEKLINEHGSSTILRERLELFSDKYSILEDKLDASKQKNSALEAENQSLKMQLQRASQDIERLQKVIDAAAEAQSVVKLDEAKEHILKTLFGANNSFSIKSLSGHIGIAESLVEYHVDFLKEHDLVDFGPLMVNSPVTYKITANGRKFFVEEVGV